MRRICCRVGRCNRPIAMPARSRGCPGGRHAIGRLKQSYAAIHRNASTPTNRGGTLVPLIPSLVEVQGLVCGGSLSCTGTQVRSRIVRGTLVPLIPSPQGCRDRCVTCGGWKWRSHTRGSFSLPGLPGRGSSGIRDVYRCEGSRNWIQWQTYPVGAPPPRDRVALHA